MYLPLELQILVCRHLTKAELKAARLVCKSLEKAATPFLFDEVFLTARYSHLEVADLVASRFGTYLKTITLSFVEYRPLSMEGFRERTFGPRTNERINGHLEHGFKVYRTARKENLMINQNGELMASLCLILTKAPNCRKMILTDYGNEDMFFNVPPPAFHPHDPLQEGDLCPFKECSLSVSDHLDFHVPPGSPYRMTPNPFHLAILAISKTKSTITELAMIHHGDELVYKESFLGIDSFDMTPRLSDSSTILLQQLTRLRIRLYDGRWEYDRRWDPQTQQSYMGRPIAKALSSAVSLESLFIEAGGDFPPEHGMTRMSAFLEGCRFPKLRSLVLMNMISKEDELLAFLKNSPCLKHLTIELFVLIVGSWEVVAQKIRSALRLRSVMVNHISDKSIQYHDDTGNIHHSVERFFLHNGENPFTRAASNLWRGRHSEWRSDIDADLDCEKRYEMFR